jgi:hypothetical protein
MPQKPFDGSQTSTCGASTWHVRGRQSYSRIARYVSHDKDDVKEPGPQSTQGREISGAAEGSEHEPQCGESYVIGVCVGGVPSANSTRHDLVQARTKTCQCQSHGNARPLISIIRCVPVPSQAVTSQEWGSTDAKNEILGGKLVIAPPDASSRCFLVLGVAQRMRIRLYLYQTPKQLFPHRHRPRTH